ncbi:helix-turn-helix transcriptional regulator [Bradyrhizobium sp. BRP22]|uniref:helix-turn-helix transcriptional regulator n=1 Tax=Bradyrhizobium sp. BRP22 TaxID=2793821 RepID=UPI001CD2CD51|nr:helix-turn-helix transcriptional regulator [Bradyrhizobium sp. BRP22]MCA1451780.1 helix-turn-helix transcriptional regulator [Bradyrhizobium sp. BRP22]
MRSAGELPERLLDLIYDAATDDELWTPIFREISELTNSVGGVLLGQSQKPRLLHFARHYNTDPSSLRALSERHVVNPWTLHMQTRYPAGAVVTSDSFLPFSDLRRTSFFDEVLRPQDLGHAAMIGLSQQPDLGVGFCLNRGPRQGPYGDDERHLLQRLTPHMMRSVRFGFQIGVYRSLQRAEFCALDRISVGVALLDRTGSVLYANEALRAMTIGGALTLRHQKLSSSSPRHLRRLEQLIDAASRGAPGGTMGIPHPTDGRLVTLLVSSVRSRDRDRFASIDLRDPAAMVFALDPAAPTTIPTAWIMDAYGLTLAEARVALQASHGHSVGEIGMRLNISPNTVKTHLRHVYAKTEVRGQVELAALIASLKVMAGGNSAN